MKLFLLGTVASTLWAQSPITRPSASSMGILAHSLQPGPKVNMTEVLNEDEEIAYLCEELEKPDAKQNRFLKRRLSDFLTRKKTSEALQKLPLLKGRFPIEIFLGKMQQGGNVLLVKIIIR